MLNMMFSRYPAQDPEDAFEWEQWFADPKPFRDCRYEDGVGWRVPADRRAAFQRAMDAIGATVEVVS